MNLVFFMDAAEHATRTREDSAAATRQRDARGRGRQREAVAHAVWKFQGGVQVLQHRAHARLRHHRVPRRPKEPHVQTGIEGTPTVFLFTDTQIVTEGFVEDINNILNSGEVPGLFAQDEKERMMTEILSVRRVPGLNPTKDVLFLARHQQGARQPPHNPVHVPRGRGFRSRCRQFPSLINCCTIDWFMEWPEEALTSVSNKFLSTVDSLRG